MYYTFTRYKSPPFHALGLMMLGNRNSRLMKKYAVHSIPNAIYT